MILHIDIRKLKHPEEAQEYLKELFAFPSWYGRNLDALHDMLTELPDTELRFSGRKETSDYAARILRVIQDAACENPNLKIGPDEEE